MPAVLETEAATRLRLTHLVTSHTINSAYRLHYQFDVDVHSTVLGVFRPLI